MRRDLRIIEILCPPRHTFGLHSAEQRSRWRSGARLARFVDVLDLAEAAALHFDASIEAEAIARAIRSMAAPERDFLQLQDWPGRRRDMVAVSRLAAACVYALDAMRAEAEAEAEGAGGQVQGDQAPRDQAEGDQGDQAEGDQAENRQVDLLQLLQADGRSFDVDALRGSD